MQSLLWPEAPCLFTSNFGVAAYGHAAGFIVQLVGFCALVLSVLVETPQSPPHADGERGRLASARG
jgi:hypothetical protein